MKNIIVYYLIDDGNTTHTRKSFPDLWTTQQVIINKYTNYSGVYRIPGLPSPKEAQMP